jgi:hypothetical protein
MKIRDWNIIKFLKKSKIEWPCPKCNSSSLKIEKDKFHSTETANSLDSRGHEYWEIEWIHLIFNGVLKCSSCNETITITGYGNVEHIRYYDQVSGQHEEDLIEEFIPTFFHPTLNVFRISDNCPELVKNEIIDSFKLFWFDLPSCANKVRTSLELLLNEQKVNKTIATKKGRRRRLKPHERIVEYKKKNEQVADFLLAIKWIGNTGSHIGTLDRNDLLDAYELLDFSLSKLYDKKETELEKLQKEINKRKGTRKKKNNRA